MMKIVLYLLLSIPVVCAATDLKPWFGNQNEVEMRATLLYQNFDSLATTAHHRKHNENDEFLTLSAAYPFKCYCGEFEVTTANTHHQNYRWDSFRVTGRYQLKSEAEGNPISAVAGITVCEAFSRALHDLSSFHHGHIECEATLSFGKKFGYPCTNDYIFRWWNVLGYGFGDVGSGWVREDAAFEYKYNERHQFRGFVNTLWGTGNNRLNPHDFKGYGSIKHQSIDVGARYGYIMGCYGTLSIQYARRVYAHNFPKNANLVLLEYYLPFGVQVSTSY